ncbi:hypothetical protein [Stakelama saccharophila]|uniref:DUF4013 domain-containing protein n=1 Tax=Stakelama saccharophila TaxID=3075605 RepID=A0ABZ0BC05_9SPHN|nr:hypothetical protein [Stakelama sp. W311]WNO54780.1 hypothetical protein RPR59_05915 [Stakelama sp. W311]
MAGMIVLGFVLAVLLVIVLAVVLGLREGRDRPWSFEIGAVIGGAFRAMGRRPLGMFGTALIVSAVPLIALYFALGAVRFQDIHPAALGPAVLLYVALYLVVAVLGDLVILRLAVTALRGEAEPPAETMRNVLAVLLPALFAAVVMGIAIAIGLAFLILPGLFLIIVWTCVMPAIVGDGTSVFQAFGRSYRLSEGARGRILLLRMLVWIGWFVASLAAGMIGGIVSTILPGSLVPILVINLLNGMVYAVLRSTVSASVFHHLRIAKEGDDGEELEAVFA